MRLTSLTPQFSQLTVKVRVFNSVRTVKVELTHLSNDQRSRYMFSQSRPPSFNCWWPDCDFSFGIKYLNFLKMQLTLITPILLKRITKKRPFVCDIYHDWKNLFWKKIIWTKWENNICNYRFQKHKMSIQKDPSGVIQSYDISGSERRFSKLVKGHH